jgi:hypothetical protein
LRSEDLARLEREIRDLRQQMDRRGRDRDDNDNNKNEDRDRDNNEGD